ncbi:hypothetical protein GYMLUDRAFT_378588 [Collybiopsis luxurians FD-317 M1]|uniref:Uncharacterized protein n=1 Tax=Collybiopsis luxurians FD-317 M1 TaxID=944289 RepID=A0A0D0BQ60_9AGAR|nr:hypothetical protein GYMLUDRAFT_378588 [Collybiopsis luxurians FD-317 M1]
MVCILNFVLRLSKKIIYQRHAAILLLLNYGKLVTFTFSYLLAISASQLGSYRKRCAFNIKLRARRFVTKL